MKPFKKITMLFFISFILNSTWIHSQTTFYSENRDITYEKLGEFAKLLEAYNLQKKEVITLEMRIDALKMIEASDQLIIHQLEVVTIPILEGNIRSLAKKDSLNNVNNKLEIGSLEGQVKKQKSQKIWWGLSGFIGGLITAALMIILI